jgi:N-carbamoyl-L-amino-acid hydrolase
MSFDRMRAAPKRLGHHPGTGGYRRLHWTWEDAELRERFAGEATDGRLDEPA